MPEDFPKDEEAKGYAERLGLPVDDSIEARSQAPYSVKEEVLNNKIVKHIETEIRIVPPNVLSEKPPKEADFKAYTQKKD